MGELRRIKPLTFDGEAKQGEDVKSWLLGLRKFFQLHQYTSNMEVLDFYQLDSINLGSYLENNMHNNQS